VFCRIGSRRLRFGQGGQIVQNFAKFVIVYFGQFIENYRNSPHFGATTVHVLQAFFTKKKWGATFSQTYLFTLVSA
jgi:hypothetical protein